MGVICHGQTPNYEKDITKINNNPIFLEKKSIEKVIVIQNNFRIFQAKNKLIKIKNELKENIIKELDNLKLIDYNKILECKSEQYYNKLLISKKIQSFEKLVKNNKKLIKKLNLIEKYSFDFPFNVQLSEEKIYKGSWNYDKKYHGYGIIYEFNSQKMKDSKTEGIFNNGILNGFGRIFLSNEEMLVGNFIYNKLNGTGEYHRNDGSIYKGSFFEGLPQGNGQEIFNNGSIFTGFYLAGKKKHGKFLWKNGNYYQGDFYNDIFNGYGIYRWGSERTYEGNWKNGKMDGKGKLILIDGSYYVGEFVNGQKCGKGFYAWNKDKYYDGEWKNDKQNGYGIYYKNGKQLKGFWINGKLISNYKKLNNKNIIYISPDNKHRTLDIGNNLMTSECKELIMVSGCRSQFNTIRSDSQNINDKNQKLKRNNTHVYMSKKIQGKKYLGNIKENTNFDKDKNKKEDKKINDFSEDEK